MKTIKYLGFRINIILLVILLVIIAVVSGLMIGYGVIGDGSSKDILKTEVWTDFVDKLK